MWALSTCGEPNEIDLTAAHSLLLPLFLTVNKFESAIEMKLSRKIAERVNLIDKLMRESSLAGKKSGKIKRRCGRPLDSVTPPTAMPHMG